MADDSLLGRLKAQREERLADEHLDLPIPSWEGNLVGRYRVLRRDEMNRIWGGTRPGSRQPGQRNPNSDRDFIAAACQAILARDEEGNLITLLEDSGVPMTYGEALAGQLGIDAQGAREVIGYVFGDNELAISAHGLKIFEWMQDTSREVEGAIVGEAPTS